MGSVDSTVAITLLNCQGSLVREKPLFVNRVYLYPHLLDFDHQNTVTPDDMKLPEKYSRKLKMLAALLLQLDKCYLGDSSSCQERLQSGKGPSQGVQAVRDAAGGLVYSE